MWENSPFGVGKQAGLLLAEGAQMAAWGNAWHSVVEVTGWSPGKVTPVRDPVTVMGGVQPVRLTVSLHVLRAHFPSPRSCSLPPSSQISSLKGPARMPPPP